LFGSSCVFRGALRFALIKVLLLIKKKKKINITI